MTTVITESGTRYEFNEDMTQVRREGGRTHRGAGDWHACHFVSAPLVGHPLSFTLQPPGITIRTTTPVVSIDATDEKRDER